jgi:large subunit ribosomal protein L29
MKASRLREHTDDELRQLREDKRKEYGDLRLRKQAGGEAQPPQRLRTMRREVARIMTVLRERGI